MERPFPESLCHGCAAPARYVATASSTFILCPVLPTKYPRQPVRECPAFRPAAVATERLVLRPLTDEDAGFVATMTDSVAGDPAAWIARQRQRYARDGFGLWLAVERASGRPVGQIGLLTQTVDGVVEPELSYHVHAPFRRRGFAVEGARAVRDFAFARFDHVIALVRPDNVASQAVARALGFVPGRTAEHAGLPHVVWRAQRPAG